MDISSYFKQAIEKKASDLHLVGGSVPALRVDGELVKLKDDIIKAKELENAIRSLFDNKTMAKFEDKRELDISREFFNARFRINLHFQEGKMGLAARFIPQNVPSANEIGFDEIIYSFTHLRDGLIIVTGPTGCGKSTTLAAMIEIINKERKAHVITIEDPIEFLIQEKQSIIEQREIGSDTKSFASGLKYALRQDPNVIMVGEMRDQETIAAALTAAETGHLVLSTLHTIAAPETIERIVDVFPAHQQPQIFSQLASVLRAVIAQQLLPRINGGLVAAREIMINNRAVANLIKQNQISQIYSVIQTSAREGMIDMNKAIDKLARQGVINETMAKNRKRDLATMAAYY